jgi:tight adherence protein C
MDINISQLIFLAATFGFATTLIWAALSLASGARSKRRLSRLTAQGQSAAGGSTWQEHMLPWMKTVAKLSASNDESWETSPLRLRFLQAGYKSESAATVFLAIKTAGVLLLPVLFFILKPGSWTLMKTAFWGIIIAAAGYYIPDFVLRQKTAARQRELLNNFPDAIDLLTVCVEAGLGLDAALVRVTDELKMKCPLLAEELRLVTLELRAGGTRQQALRHLAERTGLEELNTLVAMLVQAERFGTSIGDSLRVYSSDLRARRKARAEEAAAKIATKLLFPLMFCLFPALMFVLMGPAMINIYRNMIAGGG